MSLEAKPREEHADVLIAPGWRGLKRSCNSGHAVSELHEKEMEDARREKTPLRLVEAITRFYRLFLQKANRCTAGPLGVASPTLLGCLSRRSAPCLQPLSGMVSVIARP
jgi:hypothetical protein